MYRKLIQRRYHPYISTHILIMCIGAILPWCIISRISIFNKLSVILFPIYRSLLNVNIYLNVGNGISFFSAYHYKILDRHWGDMLIKYDKWLYYHNIGAMPSFKYYDISLRLWYHPNIAPYKCYLGYNTASYIPRAPQ